ncbi:MAG: hypothetical protein LBK60_00280 [Verrucomicrobiales bacterium]|jgi:hypothetical protein|nr:hypothetical protein [Verrucomicrobiales bacterium]
MRKKFRQIIGWSALTVLVGVAVLVLAALVVFAVWNYAVAPLQGLPVATSFFQPFGLVFVFCALSWLAGVFAQRN